MKCPNRPSKYTFYPLKFVRFNFSMDNVCDKYEVYAHGPWQTSLKWNPSQHSLKYLQLSLLCTQRPPWPDWTMKMLPVQKSDFLPIGSWSLPIARCTLPIAHCWSWSLLIHCGRDLVAYCLKYKVEESDATGRDATERDATGGERCYWKWCHRANASAQQLILHQWVASPSIEYHWQFSLSNVCQNVCQPENSIDAQAAAFCNSDFA